MEKKQVQQSLIFVVIITALLLGFAILQPEDDIERISRNAGFYCELCAENRLKISASYKVVQNGITYYVCSAHKNG